MLFTVNKNKSLSILRLVMAILIITAPSLLGSADYRVCAYMLLIITSLLFVLRLAGGGQVVASVQPPVVLLLGTFSLLSVLWVNNRGLQLAYVLVLIAIAGLFFVMTDYFSESTDEKMTRRMMYMISIGGILCSFFNFVYWITNLVPFGKKECFEQGIGSNHFLAVFTFLCMIVTAMLVRKNSALRKMVFSVSFILMLFVFVMCKSVYAWLFAVSVGVIFFSGKKSEKLFFPVSALILILFSLVTIIVFFVSKESVVFKEVFSYGNLIGHGGGFFSEGKSFLSMDYTDFANPGLLSFVYAASGIIGVLCLLGLVARVIIHYIKLRTWESVINVFVTILLLFLPMAKSMGVLVLWIALTAYNENIAGGMARRTFKADIVKKLTYITACTGVIAAYFLCQRLMVLSADKKYEQGEYMDSYSLYKAASSVNIFDAESCVGAVQSLYKSGNISEHYTEAIELVEKAQNRDKKNIVINGVEAQVHFECGRYDLAVQEYSYISSNAKVNSKYNLLLVESLYKIIEGYPQGSPEAIEYYEKIVQIGKTTNNLDYREKINNIADKALAYTRRRVEE